MAKDYEVLELQERTKMGDRGKVEHYFAALVRTAKGTLFTVNLSEDQLDKATAEGIIGARAKELDALKV